MASDEVWIRRQVTKRILVRGSEAHRTPLTQLPTLLGNRNGPEQPTLIQRASGKQQIPSSPPPRRAVVLARLRVRPERAHIIVANHDDEAGTKDREARLPADSRPVVAVEDRIEGAVDVTDMCTSTCI
jgi:hypothetical protein